MLTLVMGAAIHDLSHLAHRCMTSATSHIPLPAYHCSRLCPTSQGWGILFQQRGMVYPFLNKLLRGCVRWDLQCALLEVTSCIRLSQKRKADLIIEIEKTANMSADSHAKICRFLLNLKTKTQIDTLIWSSMPARTKTKAASIDALIRADADAHAPNNSMNAASIDVAAMQLVPWWPPEADACYTPGGQARACARLRKRLSKEWKKAAARLTLSKQIVAAIDAVVDESHPVRRVSNIVRDVERRVGKPLTHGAAYVFFYRKLKARLRKLTKKHRNCASRRSSYTIHGVYDRLHPEQEMRRMWDNDGWLYKHSLLNTKAIRRHVQKIHKHTGGPVSWASESSADSA